MTLCWIADHASISITRCFRSSLASDKLVPALHRSPCVVVHRIGVRTVGRQQVWFDKIRGFVSQQRNGLTRTVCWRVVLLESVKIAGNVTDGRQQLFAQQNITIICTIHFRPLLHENQTSAPVLGDTD